MNTHHTLWYFSTLSLNEGCRVIFQFFLPLHLKQDKTLDLFTSLIRVDWIHSWPQGASSHCSLLCFFCWECTLRRASSADWPASGKWRYVVGTGACALINSTVSTFNRAVHRLACMCAYALSADSLWTGRAKLFDLDDLQASVQLSLGCESPSAHSDHTDWFSEA